MRVFRRSSAGETDSKAAGSRAEQTEDAPAKTKSPAQTGKGRPTPKRSEAERGRYQSIRGGTTSGRANTTASSAPARKLTPEEKAREKDRARAQRIKQTEAMRRGEEWALGPRDAGKVRRLARDYVDSHRRVSNYMMYIIFLMIIALPALGRAASNFLSFIEFGVLAILIIDAYLLGQKIKKLAAERFPNEPARGIAMYAGMRALQLRFMRFPKPQVKPGDKI